MCGIVGGSWREGSRDAHRRVSEALARLAHRGPDDRGVEVVQSAHGVTTAIGQTRLSIIDLTAGGHQPMLSADGRFAIVFNGELYNFKELRQTLVRAGHVFRTQSDTEVLLTAWMQWGPGCLPRLIGMFAFVVHDRRESTLTCVRDAFGIKPLFYCISDGGFRFASEMAAIAALSALRPTANLQRGYDYLVHADYDSSEETFIEGVHHLRPGHLLVYDIDQGCVTRNEQWWKAPVTATSQLSFADAAEAVRELFLDSIRFHLRSDVPLGAALSGGVDSSAVVCAMRHVEPDMPIHTFSYVARGTPLSEEAWVDIVNAHTGAIGRKVEATAEDLSRDIDTIVTAQGEPFGSTSIYAQYRVYQLAKEHGITVTLDGQGADELLAGYSGYPGQRMHSILETRGPLAAHAYARRWSRWPGRSYAQAWAHLGRATLPDGLYQRARGLIGKPVLPDWIDGRALEEAGVRPHAPRPDRHANARGRRVAAHLAYSLQERGLPHLLRHGDRNSMQFSLESRVPFLTLPLAELLLSLPEHYLISESGETKSVFRTAMRGIVPDSILDRRDKIGFATPERDWLLQLAPKLRAWLSYADEVPFLKKPQLMAAFDDMIAGRTAFSWQAWRWVNYVRWHASITRT